MKQQLMDNNMGIKDGVHITARGPYIGCHSGKKFYPLSVKAKDIDIEDIAHALSKQCRFAGHTDKFYSVAEHCVRVSKIVPYKFHINLPMAGLLHDGSEAYLVDLPRPIKKIADFSIYRQIEKITQQVIYKKFLKCNIITYDQKFIDDADNLLLGTEARDLMKNPYWCHGMPKLDTKIKPWGPEKAKRKFLERYEELKNG